MWAGKADKMKVRLKRYLLVFSIVQVILVLKAANVYAEPLDLPITVQIGNQANNTASSIQVLLLLTVLSLAPSIIIMLTSFTRIIVVLSFLRNALGTQQMPPNQVLIGLALFLTLFVMRPVISDINEQAYQPLKNEQIGQQEALDRSSAIIKNFMIEQILDHNREKDLALFMKLSGMDTPINRDELPNLPLTVVVPAFLISELTIAFKIGFLIYIPFLIIDMVVSSTLMSMGMMMLSPVMISLPFKILLFVMVDGWNLLIQSIVRSFG